MDQVHEVLREIWQIACRHEAIAVTAKSLAARLAKHMPLVRLMVRRLDRQHLTLETVAHAQPKGSKSVSAGKTALTAAGLKRVLTWAGKQRAIHAEAAARGGELELLIPNELVGDVLVGPLQGLDGPTGVLILVADARKPFRREHERLAESLWEPFSAALENDRRLHELAALRAAADADRQALLSRLGRQDFNETIVGAESGLRHVMERVELVAQSDVPILILGETGTGKEVVSRGIHVRSPRCEGPFIRVNCGAIPPELVDSQLFGHEKGSFTGASDQRKGWFERADGGTLFLDEIGELPLPAQVRLLRVLQDGEIERVGGQRPVKVEVRIVAATYRDLAAMVKAGTFREDLWYRINVFPILLPRLHERIEDIPALARHFAQRAANRFGLPYVEPDASELGLLINYNWPGNIRELGAVIDRAAILGNGKRLEVAKALGFSIQPAKPRPPSPPVTMYEVIPEEASAVSAGPELPTAIVTLDVAMRQHIERALVATRGRIEGKNGTAALLRINPHTLRARMRKLGVSWDRFREK